VPPAVCEMTGGRGSRGFCWPPHSRHSRHSRHPLPGLSTSHVCLCDLFPASAVRFTLVILVFDFIPIESLYPVVFNPTVEDVI
jgi:hypothetical protein